MIAIQEMFIGARVLDTNTQCKGIVQNIIAMRVTPFDYIVTIQLDAELILNNNIKIVYENSK